MYYGSDCHDHPEHNGFYRPVLVMILLSSLDPAFGTPHVFSMSRTSTNDTKPSTGGKEPEKSDGCCK